ncbi:transposase family protein [Streptomyces sp. SLBN-118]|uniref:transposase family protein n=1 Tax=Streptomyces sp. SLBN-118 TaxID=2768454 RepID=UPI001150F18F|nr:transposase family protein [Streptomyces sp. SLBN-118]
MRSHAVAAGARSYAAVGQWLRRAPQDTLGRLGFPVRGALGERPAASMDAVRRVIERLRPEGLAALARPVVEPPDGPARLAADGRRGLRS